MMLTSGPPHWSGFRSIGINNVIARTNSSEWNALWLNGYSQQSKHVGYSNFWTVIESTIGLERLARPLSAVHQN